MRRRKHKHTRRAVAFYKLNYGFHEPYKVLVDGNFIHAAMSTSLVDLERHIGNLLGARVKLYVTRCITHELKEMGSDLVQAYKAARSYELHKCAHEPGQCTPSACIKETIGEDNDQRWWIATQDSALRTHLEQVPACPLIFATINGIHLHSPPGLARETAKQATESQQVLPSHELKSEALKDLEALRPKIKTSAVFRKKKAKGPNPLSVKKKRPKVEAAGGPSGEGPGLQAQVTASGGKRVSGTQHEQNAHQDEMKAHADRKRKRRRKHSEDGKAV